MTEIPHPREMICDHGHEQKFKYPTPGTARSFKCPTPGRSIDQGNVNAVVFLDLKKAFDTFVHDILLSKLMKYGVHGTSYDWFRSY